jgi:NAD(P)-dependent dehydrogenase (short-subunit alcohol dehydrogenase family)
VNGAAVITGAGRPTGIGFAAAKALAADGWPVLLSDLELEDSVLAGLPAGADSASFAADVTDSAQVEALGDFAVERWGAIGAWVNNAGAMLGAGPIAGVVDEDWQRCQAINAGGCFHGCRAAVRRMQAASEPRGGRIVNVSSQAGKTGPPYFAAYAAAKFAVIGLTQSVAAEVGRSGITVNAVCPGTVDTPLLDEPGGVWETMAAARGISVERARERAPRAAPIGRMVEPGEVASMIAYLCSDAAAAISGAAINITGGDEVH